jgi:hypothetical protein
MSRIHRRPKIADRTGVGIPGIDWIKEECPAFAIKEVLL